MVFRTSFKSAKLGHVLSTKGTFQICTPQQFLQNIYYFTFFFWNYWKKIIARKMDYFFDISTLLLQNIYVYKPYNLETNLKIH